jgi:hypothetical protein
VLDTCSRSRQHHRFLANPSEPQTEILRLDQQLIARHDSYQGFRRVTNDKAFDPATADDPHRDNLSRQPIRWLRELCAPIHGGLFASRWIRNGNKDAPNSHLCHLQAS